ncbi:hypothetical protein D3C86_1889470 [compost metagenome]
MSPAVPRCSTKRWRGRSASASGTAERITVTIVPSGNCSDSGALNVTAPSTSATPRSAPHSPTITYFQIVSRTGSVTTWLTGAAASHAAWLSCAASASANARRNVPVPASRRTSV